MHDNVLTPDDTILQSAVCDGGVYPTHRVGQTHAPTFRKLDLAHNTSEAALADIDAGIPSDPTVIGIGPLNGPWAAADPATVLGLAVRKSGFKTGVTNGRVRALLTTNLSVEYPSTTRYFDDVLEVEGVDPLVDFSQGGDSGAVVVDGNREALGLVFAGENDEDVTYVVRIANVFGALGVQSFL
ncbi:MAG TPA: hypothetical protein VII08_09720 [Myxococcales bacterium]